MYERIAEEDGKLPWWLRDIRDELVEGFIAQREREKLRADGDPNWWKLTPEDRARNERVIAKSKAKQ